jgi:hypothetical protein
MFRNVMFYMAIRRMKICFGVTDLCYGEVSIYILEQGKGG